MSSTNRSKKEKQNSVDYYKTPIRDIEIFLQQLKEDRLDIFTGNRILDPCSGGDNKSPMSYPTAIKNKFNNVVIDTIDVRPDSMATIKANYLDYQVREKPYVIITNPPFNISMKIINKALKDSKRYVIMLLRLNFLESQKRFNFFKEYMPSYIYVHHKRMSFREDGKTDSIAYAHFIWDKTKNPDFAKTKII